MTSFEHNQHGQLADSSPVGLKGKEDSTMEGSGLTLPATHRGPGRPRGTPNSHGRKDEGRAHEIHGMPTRTEVARMTALAVLASAFPAIFRTMSDADLDALEQKLEKAIEAALRKGE